MCDACISVRRDYPNESVRLTPYQANSKCFHGVFSIFQDNPFFCKKQFLFLLTNKIFLFSSCLPAEFPCSTGENISNFFMRNRKSDKVPSSFVTEELIMHSRLPTMSILHGKSHAIQACYRLSRKKTVPGRIIMLFCMSHGTFSEKQQQSCSRKRSMRTMHEREAPGITWSTPPRPARAAYMVTHHSTSEAFHRQRARFKLSPADAPAFPGIMHFQNRCLKRSPENSLPFRSRPCSSLSSPPSAQLIPHFQHMRLPPVHICRKKFMGEPATATGACRRGIALRPEAFFFPGNKKAPSG